VVIDIDLKQAAAITLKTTCTTCSIENVDRMWWHRILLSKVKDKEMKRIDTGSRKLISFNL